MKEEKNKEIDKLEKKEREGNKLDWEIRTDRTIYFTSSALRRYGKIVL